jgi:hypothetical protein
MITKKQFIEDAMAHGVTDSAQIAAKAQEYVSRFGDFKEVKKVTPKTPEQLQSLINAEKRKSFQDDNIFNQALAGAGKVAYSSSVAPAKKLYSALTGEPNDVDETGQEYAIASQDNMSARLGEIAGDLAITMLPVGAAAGAVNYGSKLTRLGLKGLASGITSAGIHAGQRQSMGEEAKPMEDVAEVAISTALPVGVGSLAQYLKKTAPSVLQSALKPARKYSRQINKPQFQVPLEEGLATNFGGVEALHRNVTSKVNKVGNVFRNVLEKSDTKINHDDVLIETQRLLKDKIGKNGFTAKDYNDAMGVAEDAIATVAYKSKSVAEGEPLLLDGLSAWGLKSNAGKKGNWSAFSADVKTPNEAKFWESYSRALSSKMDEAIESQSTPDLLREYRIAKKDLARLVPIEKTVNNAVDRINNNFKPGLLDINAGGVGANLAGGLGAMGAMSARRGLSTIGGANMLYGAGKALEKPHPYMSQMLRSSLFNE